MRAQMRRAAAVVVLVAALVVTAACTDEKTAARVLRDNGYTNVEVGGYAAWACSDSDTYATKFKATSPSGSKVTGAVCNGAFKGATIRFD